MVVNLKDKPRSSERKLQKSTENLQSDTKMDEFTNSFKIKFHKTQSLQSNTKSEFSITLLSSDSKLKIRHKSSKMQEF